MKRIILLFIFFFAILAYISYFQKQHDTSLLGKKVPPLALPNESGTIVRLEDLTGKWVLVSFWATWCPPCIYEMPSMEQLYQKYRTRGLEILAISVDEGGWTDIREFLRKIKLSFPILWDVSSEAASAYGTFQLPETYLLDPEHQVIRKFIGPQEWVAP